MRYRMPKRIVPLLLTICLLVSAWGPFTTLAAEEAGRLQQTDLAGHWAEKTLGEWLTKGWIRTDSEGSVQPDRPILRGEMIAFANRAFGLTEKADIAFSDLSVSDWEYDEVSIAVKTGYIQGYEDGTIRVRNKITRQEIAALIAGMLELQMNAGRKPNESATFKDHAQIASWSDKAVASMTAHNIIDGYEDGSFRPNEWVTRAEAIVMLDRAKYRQGDQIMDEAGTFGPKHVIQTVNGQVTIKAGGVSLRNMLINGDVVIDPSVGVGEIILDGVEVTGMVTIRAGKVKLSGTLSKIEAASSAVEIDIQSGSIKELLVTDKAAGAKVNVNQLARISKLVLDGTVDLKGQGEIQQAIIHKGAEKSTFDRQPNRKESSAANSYTPSYSYGGSGSGGNPPVIDPNEQPRNPKDEEGIMDWNSSFEEGTGAEGVHFWTTFFTKEAEGSRILRSSEQAFSNSSSMKAVAVQSGGLYQNLHLQPGNYKISASYYVPLSSSTEGTLQLFVQFMDDRGKWLREAVSEVRPSQYDRGQWNTFHWILQVPESISGKAVKIAQIGVDLQGFNANEMIYLDDITLSKSSKAPVSVSVASVNSEAGSIRVTLNEVPDNPPAIRDFKVTQKIDNGISSTIYPDSINWDEASKVVTLTFPVVEKTANEQRVVYGAAYRETLAVQSEEVVIPADPTQSVIANPSFEASLDGNWGIWMDREYNFAGTSIERSTDFAKSGEYSLKASGVKIGGPFQYVTVVPGNYKFKASYYTPAGTQTDGTVKFSVNFYDAGYIGTITDVKHDVQDTSGEWNTIEWSFEVPETYNGRTVERIQIVFNLEDFVEEDVVFVDDLGLFRLDVQPIVQISAVSAENGTIRAVLNTIPDNLPAIQDFTVKQTVQAGIEVVIEPTAIAWDESTQTVTLTVPIVEETANEQRVVYRVAYQETPAIESNEVVIPARLLIMNPSFEASLDGNWSIWMDREYNFAGTSIERSTEFAKTGEHSLKASGVKIGGPYQYVNVTPGNYKLSATYYTPAGAQTDGTVKFSVNFYDAGYIGTITDVKHDVQDTLGEWHTIEWTFEVPEALNRRNVERLQIVFNIEDFTESDELFIDDVILQSGLETADKHLPIEDRKTTPNLILFEMPFTDASTTPAGIQENIAYIDSLPFDGITISPPGILAGLMGGSELSYEDIYDEIEVLDGLFQNLKENYLHIQINKPINRVNPTEFSGDFFDDVAWGIVEQNFKNLARAAKEVGIHNFFLDNEEYWDAFLHHPGLSYYPDKTLEEYEDKARQRGKELMNAILSEIPDAKFVHLHGPYLSDKRTPAWFSKFPYLNLYGPLFVGMMEAVKEGGNQGTIIDGGELYLERTEGQFMDSYQYRKYEMPSFLENTFIPESLRQSYPSTVKIGAGLYNREIGESPMNAGIMRSTLENALRTSEEIVWLFHEPLGGHGNWLIPGSVDEPWFNAVLGARQAIQEKPLGTNRIYNSGFEFGKVNWKLYEGSEIKDLVDLRKVAYSNASGLSLNRYSEGAKQQLTNLLEGRVYDLSAWAQVGNTDDKAQIGIVFRDDQEQVIAEHSFEVSTLDYSRGSMAFITPTQFDTAEVYVKREGSNDYIFVDDVFLREWIVTPTAVSAVNGTIQVVLDAIPYNPPAIQDFTVKQVDYADVETIVEPTAIAWDEASKTVTLTIPPVEMTANEQRVVYRVAYRGTLAIESEEVIIPADPTQSVIANPSFEASLDGNWAIWMDREYNFAGTSIERSTEFAKTGAQSLKASGVKIGGPYQYVTIAPGNYTFKGSYYTPVGTQTDGTVKFSVNFYDAGYIGTITDVKHDVQDTSGEWNTIEWSFEVPETYNGRTVERIQIVFNLEDFVEEDVVFIDDLTLHKNLAN
ncbi:S-layer homology domain-containing protein [Paenibacillus eucommiae]|uniref:SLH domain-containing protein n=1 Tax=Paenibacillus eucommiae TaxID=1355755 RepID=A0ABS4IZP7_9BACL|nr:S-layer homology domain-containing protein [Paenibacillus eucommiae]MBP1993064.1 hypothetical protein [Paenibacillus eucommiae]